MILSQLLELARRRWYVYAISLLGALATIGVMQAVPRTYTFESEVVFAAPEAVSLTTEYAAYAETMINYAGAVDRAYNDRYPTTQLSAPYATLFGNGFREGIAVRISSVGNQWTRGFDRPVIVITVNSASPKDARDQLLLAVKRVEETSARLQDEAGTPDSLRITTQWDDQEIASGSFGNTRLSVIKGAGVLVMVAFVFATTIAATIERLKAPDRSAAGQWRNVQATTARPHGTSAEQRQEAFLKP